jgi:DNA-binding CsgD family transcriptional regulator
VPGRWSGHARAGGSTDVADDRPVDGAYRANDDRSQEGAASWQPLTSAEQRVLTLLGTHRTLAAIGVQLGISRATVKSHVFRIYEKLGAHTRGQAVELAANAGLLPPAADSNISQSGR